MSKGSVFGIGLATSETIYYVYCPTENRSLLDRNLTNISVAKTTGNAYNTTHMDSIEAHYPISFRKRDAEMLGKHLRARHSVVLIGMKRVGIGNFLRFFLRHPDIGPTYIRDGQTHLFISIDLNDLIERELFPFWILTLKRITDAARKSLLPYSERKQIEGLFLDSIQSQDLFFTIDNVRRAVVTLVENNILPTIFFVRFDRIKDAVNAEFFSNLLGLKEATLNKLSYVFTSFRSLDNLSEAVFPRASLASFSQTMYVKPTSPKDTQTIYKEYKEKYKLYLTKEMEKRLLEFADGYVQYLALSVIILSEKNKPPKDEKELFTFLSGDERIVLQSEELWESLATAEKDILLKFITGKKLTEKDEKNGEYLFDTGILAKNGKGSDLFSPLFGNFLKGQEQKNAKGNHITEFTKKEHLLFLFLQERINEICERERIIEKVWSDEEAFGITDWAIDRLVARVRSKLKIQESGYEIQTIKTRGYKLIKV